MFNTLTLVTTPFYLLRPQSFSFHIVSEFVKFSNFMSQAWGFWHPVLSRGECAVIVPGEGFCSLQIVSWGGWFWMKLIPALNINPISSVKDISPHNSILAHMVLTPWICGSVLESRLYMKTKLMTSLPLMLLMTILQWCYGAASSSDDVLVQHWCCHRHQLSTYILLALISDNARLSRIMHDYGK